MTVVEPVLYQGDIVSVLIILGFLGFIFYMFDKRFGIIDYLAKIWNILKKGRL